MEMAKEMSISAQILVAHVLLEGLDVVTGFDAVHGERMPEVMCFYSPDLTIN